ncbi:MAG: nuclear transport factor 2 family protein [Pseudomonadota bacterium]
MNDAETLALLDDFAAAFNRHDIDALMGMMTDDCVFNTSGGDTVFGTRFEGHDAVREGFLSVFAQFPDAQWNDAEHFFAGDRALTAWRFTGTDVNGKRTEVLGCDVFTLRDGKVQVKDSYRKNRPPF